MPAIFEYHYRINDEDIDGQGHVNNLVYLKWMQTAAVEHSTAQGWPGKRYTEAGAGWVVRTHFIEYLQPAFSGEDICVLTWVAGFQKIRSLRKYRIVRPQDGVLLAKAETDWTYISLEHRVPRRIPPELMSAFEIVPPDREPGALSPG